MSKTENSAPNIVLIVTDQQRWDTLGCLGYDHVITPHIDRLAARGVAFSRAFVQGAVCGPSRNSIVSGHHGPDPDDYDLYLMQFGLRRPALTYYRDVPNWPDYLGAAVWPHDEELFIDNCIGRWSVEAVRTHDFAKPLFLWSGFAGPHDPFDAPASALTRYEGVEIGFLPWGTPRGVVSFRRGPG